MREIFLQMFRQMHALVQDGGDAEFAVGQRVKENQVLFMSAVEAVDAIFRRDRMPDPPLRRQLGETGEEAVQIGIGSACARVSML